VGASGSEGGVSGLRNPNPWREAFITTVVQYRKSQPEYITPITTILTSETTTQLILSSAIATKRERKKERER
jgi:hypothetical protein